MIIFLLVSCGEVFMSNYGKDEGNLVVRFPGAAGDDSAVRAAVPAAGTQALLEYGVTLTGGSQTVNVVVPAGETSTVLSVTPGVWNIQAEAYLPGPVHVGTGSAQVRVVAGQTNNASVKMIFDNTTPASVEVSYMGTTYTAAYIGDNTYSALITTYDTTQTTAQVTINKAVPDQVIVDSSNTEITGPITVSIPSAQGNTASTTFTVNANDLEGFMAPYDVKLIFAWLVDTTASAMDLKARFSITTTGANGVTEAFNALHWLINTPEAGDFTQIIRLGDYIELPAPGFTVNGDGVAAAISPTTPTPVMVVGINSFNGINGNNTPHVVFHFKNIPGARRMEASDINTNGYAGSEMPAYLNGAFLTGLTSTAAGVPSSVLWAPSRVVSSGGYPPAGADTVTDTIWLPTEYEMVGTHLYSSSTHEAPGTQARLEYYTDDTSRIKYNSSNSAIWYWLASPYYGNAADFSVISAPGDPAYVGASSTSPSGVAPAFCVK
jgi:hypothetical protein